MLLQFWRHLSLTAVNWEKAMAPHSSTLAWKIPWMEELGGLQSMGLLRVKHDWVTSLSLFTFMHWRRKWQPTPVFLPGEFQGRESLAGCRLRGRTESDITKWLSSSSSCWMLFTVLFQREYKYMLYKGLSDSTTQCIIIRYTIILKAWELEKKWALSYFPVHISCLFELFFNHKYL